MKVIFNFDDEVLGPQISIETAEVQSESETGVKDLKYVNAEDLQNLFQNTTLDSGWLPRVRVLKYLKVSGGDQVIFVIIPPHIRKTFVNTGYDEFEGGIDLPIPYTILGFRCRNGKLINSVCGCTKYDPIHTNSNFCSNNIPVTCEMARMREGRGLPPGSTRIYQFPYGNVFSGDHRICWGNLELPDIRGLEDIEVLTEMFFTAAVNGDLFQTPVNGLGFIDFLRHMKDKPMLQDEDFAPTNLTLDTLVASLSRNSRY